MADREISIATAQTLDQKNFTQKAGSSGTFEVDENLSQRFGTTTGTTVYAARTALSSIKIESAQASGALLFSKQLDSKISEDVRAFSDRFVYYTIDQVTITLRCTAPWSTASGSAQLFISPDPENGPNTKNAENLELAMNLLDSQQVSSKGEAALSAKSAQLSNQVIGKWRYCKTGSTSVPRLESMGWIGLVVRGAPALGDGSTWAATLAVTYIFSHRTMNVPTTTSITQCSFTSDTNNLMLSGFGTAYAGFSGPYHSPDLSGTFISLEPVNMQVSVCEKSNTKDCFWVDTSFNSCFCVVSGGTIAIYVLISVLDISSMANPIITGSTVNEFTGYISYDVQPSDQALVAISRSVRDVRQNKACFSRALKSFGMFDSKKSALLNSSFK
ncbi:putative structural protein [Wenling hepe-like virus 4]|uniref:putative structural protein n=1 Tax=Wenling hepe-like virus 4 TaxID=1923496 RepID=UPI00090B20EA|nr:putative structural protein [Wenling hepe-like virus 4]APG77821.1 putative structural protein [Wenling hepe-like virus 4]